MSSASPKRPFGPSRRATIVTVVALFLLLYGIVFVFTLPFSGGLLASFGWAALSFIGPPLFNKKLRAMCLDWLGELSSGGRRRRARHAAQVTALQLGITSAPVVAGGPAGAGPVAGAPPRTPPPPPPGVAGGALLPGMVAGAVAAGANQPGLPSDWMATNGALPDRAVPGGLSPNGGQPGRPGSAPPAQAEQSAVTPVVPPWKAPSAYEEAAAAQAVDTPSGSRDSGDGPRPIPPSVPGGAVRMARFDRAATLGAVAQSLGRAMPPSCAVRADAFEAVVWNSVATQRCPLAGAPKLEDALDRLLSDALQVLALAADFVRRHGMTSWPPADLWAEPRSFSTERAIYLWYELGGRPVLVLDEIPVLAPRVR